MEEPNAIQRIGRMGLKLAEKLAFLPPLFTRLVLGWSFHLAGKGKLDDIEQAVKNFTKMGIAMPEFNARFIGALECYGGILLMIGLLTRPVAALLGATMLVALMTAHAGQVADIWKEKGDFADVVPIMFGASMLWLLVYGPGLISIDAIIRKALHIDEPATTAQATTIPTA